LVVIAGALAIAASVVLGLFAFIALSAIILVTAAMIGIRVWWLKRKLGDTSAAAPPRSQQAKSQSVIEGEFRVVDKDSDEA
jgi:predicted lipid-binding transport protein (Tim44 family)